MENKLFIPRQLKTIEVDVEKKIYRVNGEDFGKGCSEFSIQCDGPESFHIKMNIDGTLLFVDYLPGEEPEIFTRNDTIARLEEALLAFAERAVTKKATREEVKVLPQVAHELIEIANLDKV